MGEKSTLWSRERGEASEGEAGAGEPVVSRGAGARPVALSADMLRLAERLW